MSVQFEAMAMALAKAIVESDQISLTQKESIFRAALQESPLYRKGGDIEFEIMTIMLAAREHEEGR